MKKFLVGIALLVGLVYADNISYSWTPSNTDTLTPSRYKADRNAVKNVVNGNLDNANLKSTANIAQSKIDSSGGWISNTVGIFQNNSPFWELHSQYGLKTFINDSVTYDKELIWISDSTDSMMILSNDSLIVFKPTNIHKSLNVQDSIISGALIRSGDSIVADNGARIVNLLTVDSVNADYIEVVNTGVNSVLKVNSIGGADTAILEITSGSANWEIMNNADDLHFFYSNTEKARITNDGRFSIGRTVAPTVPLEVQSNGSANTIKMFGRDNGTDDECTIQMRNFENTSDHCQLQGIDSRLDIKSSTGTTVITLDDNGLGIDDNTPTYKLDVNGDTRVDSLAINTGCLSRGAITASTDGAKQQIFIRDTTSVPVDSGNFYIQSNGQNFGIGRIDDDLSSNSVQYLGIAKSGKVDVTTDLEVTLGDLTVTLGGSKLGGAEYIKVDTYKSHLNNGDISNGFEDITITSVGAYGKVRSISSCGLDVDANEVHCTTDASDNEYTSPIIYGLTSLRVFIGSTYAINDTVMVTITRVK